MLITYPNPILKEKARPIKNPQDPEIKDLIFEMLEIMKKHNGLGLAAPQAGKSLRLTVIQYEGETYILINPKFKYRSWKKETAEEGCLSFPGKFIPVKRHAKVKVSALDKDGKKIVLKASGLLARALQHEIDHLDGILFIDRK